MNDNLGGQFVDTNVLIYAHDVSSGFKHERAVALLETLWSSRTGHLSIPILQEFFVTVTQKLPKPLSPERAIQIIGELAVWEVHRPDVDDVLDAIQLHQRYQLSFWDAMVLNSAVQLGCETLWSEDLNPGQQYSGVLVRNPFRD